MSAKCVVAGAETTVAMIDGVLGDAGAAFVAGLASLVPPLLLDHDFTLTDAGRLAFLRSLREQRDAVYALATQHKMTTGVYQAIGGAIGGANDPNVTKAQAALTAAQQYGQAAIAAAKAELQTAQHKQILLHNKKVACQPGPTRRAQSELGVTASQAELTAQVASSRAASASAAAASIAWAESNGMADGRWKAGTGVVGTPSLRRLAHTDGSTWMFFPFLFVLQFPRKSLHARIAIYITPMATWPPT